jgi:hypothetical protein
VKITPAHDPNDFNVGKRHSLEFINILDDDGNINDNGGQFCGQPRFKVRRDQQSVWWVGRPADTGPTKCGVTEVHASASGAMQPRAVCALRMLCKHLVP